MPIISPKIPHGLEELMRGLAKSVIKENPENIYEFAAEYFERLLTERDGSVDQSYKKFATYKVYKKTKLERKKRERDEINFNSDQDGASSHTREISSNDYAEKVDSIAAPSPPPKRMLTKEQVSISSECEIDAAIIAEAPIADDEGSPNMQSVNSEEKVVGDDGDDIENMVLDDEMAQAALKIQSSFRGHKVRQEMKNQKSSPETGDEQLASASEPDVEQVVVAADEAVDSQHEAGSCEETVPVEETLNATEDEELANMLVDPEIAEATLKIQSAYRGHKARRDIKSVTQEKEDDDGALIENESAAATNESNHSISHDELNSDNDNVCNSSPQTMGEDFESEALALESSDNVKEENENASEGECANTKAASHENEKCEERDESDPAPETLDENSQESVEANVAECADGVARTTDITKECLPSEINEETGAEGMGSEDKINEKANDSLTTDDNETADATATDVEEQERATINEDESGQQTSSDQIMIDIKAEAATDVNEEEAVEVESPMRDDINGQLPQESFEKQKSVEEAVCEQKIISYLEPTTIEQIAESRVTSRLTTLAESNVDSGEKEPSTEIKYKRLQESVDHEQQSPVHADNLNEKCESTNENSIDADSMSEGKKSSEGEEQVEQSSVPKLENILQASISPYDLIDEIVNEAATLKATEIFPGESGFEDKSGEDLDKIINPEHISLDNSGEEINDGKESESGNKSMDEILNPDKEESEIPEDSSLPLAEDFPSVVKTDDDDKALLVSNVNGGEENEFSDLPLDDPELEEAATKIQAAFRGHQVRRDKDSSASVDISKEQPMEEFADLPLDDPELEEAATKIQAAFRGHQVRKDKDGSASVEVRKDQPMEEFADLPLDDPELEEAATKIQAAFRGHQVRKDKDGSASVDISKDQPMEEFADLPLDDPELEEAATKIQAAFRGHHARKDMESIKSPEPSKEQPTLESDVSQMALDDPDFQEAETKTQADTKDHEDGKNKESLSPLEISASDMNEVANVIDDVMEEAAVKIQSVFRGHQVRKDNKIVKFNSENSNEGGRSTFVVEQCSEANEEQDETEQQDTSADVEEIQESESTEHNGGEEVTIEQETEETNEQDDDEPTEQAEGESSGQQQQQDDDDVANMVLDDDMAQAALKIQSTFRGHKTRMEMKSQQECKEAEQAEEEQKQSEVEEELANMLLDPDIADATLKIQSAFRGQKARKEIQDKKNDDNEDDQKKEEESEEKNESPPEQSSSTSTEKSAQQLQEEEDIANLVMDDEMEKTALKIQSAFRGKIKRKPKDGEESYESSSGEQGDEEEEEEEEEEIFKNSDEQPADIYEYFAMSNDYSHDEVDSNGCLATRQSYTEDVRFEGGCAAFDQTIYPDDEDDILHLMHGGGIFVEPSADDSAALEQPLAGSAGEDGDRNNSDDKDKPQSQEFSGVASITVEEEEEEVVMEDETKLKFEQVSSELKALESFDFKSNKDSAEAMYYSLKKNEIEAQKRFEEDGVQQQGTLDDCSSKELYASVERADGDDVDDDDDDDDVVIKTPPSATNANKMLKYRMSMDDSILSQDYSRQKMRSSALLEQVSETTQSVEEDGGGEGGKGYSDEIVDEDQFDDFYPGNIRSKIMASSVSIADSDYFDPTNNKSIIDDDTIKTALETIHSTDSESTIGSAATRIQVNDRNLTSRRNNNFQYSSIGNAAIDKSLDDFIQSQELRIDRFDEEPEGYTSPPPKKQESCDDYTDDCTESERKIAGVIEIKLEQKHFLTVDERRRTLHREDAIQRNSTRSVEEESSKSSNASCEKNAEKVNDNASATTVQTPPAGVQGQNSIIDTEIAVPVLEKQKSALTIKNVKVPMRRQKTMPVQIESNVIRVLPKHLRKRIRSAESEKKKRSSK